MQSPSYQSYASPGVKTLIAEEVKKFLTLPLVKSCALVLITMLLMVTIALSLGIWWDGLWSEGYNFPRGTQKPLVPGIVVVAPMLDLAEGAAKLGGLGAPIRLSEMVTQVTPRRKMAADQADSRVACEA